jgi:DNA-binding NarL/FixJ family response regulator
VEKKKKRGSQAVAVRKKSSAGNPRRDGLPTLTDREFEVLEAIGKGRSTSDIASQMRIAVSTVRKHRENMMRKLDLHTTAEIILYVVLHRDEMSRGK